MEHLSNRAQIWSLNDLIRHSQNNGGHFFDKDAMKFFKSKISEKLHFGINNIYFVSSEQGLNGIRRYSVRKYDPKTSEIDTVGLGFQAYKTLAPAQTVARKLTLEET